MEPITLILTALVAGLSAGTQTVATQAVTESFQTLKALLQRKLTGKPKALETFADYERDPGTYEKSLQKTLIDIGIDERQDRDLIAAATQVMKLVPQANIASNQIINQGSVENQIGVSYGPVTMYGRPPKEGQ